MCLFSSCSCENSVHGGEPMTSRGLSRLITFQHRSLSSALSKSKPFLMSIAMPWRSPYRWHCSPTRSGLKISAMSTLFNPELPSTPPGLVPR